MTSVGVSVLPWTRWQLPPEVALGLSAILVTYLALIGPLRSVIAKPEPVEGYRVAAFVTGILTLFLALTGPLGDLAGTFLFSAHMVQHLMLTVIAPPLILFGTPGWLIRPLVLGAPLAPFARFITRPTIAFAVFSVILTAWHLPVLYNLSLADRAVHIAMHLMFIASAVVGWWPLMSPLPELPRLSLPMQMLYVTLLGIPMVVVAAFVTLADAVLYPHYAAAPRLWGISPLQDQKIGGVIMWVPGHSVFLVALTIVFFRWANDSSGEPEGRADRRREAKHDA